MWTSARSSSLRHARCLPPEINGGSDLDVSSDVASLHLLQTASKHTGRAGASRNNGFRLRLRYAPGDIRLCS